MHDCIEHVARIAKGETPGRQIVIDVDVSTAQPGDERIPVRGRRNQDTGLSGREPRREKIDDRVGEEAVALVELDDMAGVEPDVIERRRMLERLQQCFRVYRT